MLKLVFHAMLALAAMTMISRYFNTIPRLMNQDILKPASTVLSSARPAADTYVRYPERIRSERVIYYTKIVMR